MRAHDGIVRRIVCLFSCGAASAVATKIALQAYGDQLPVVIQNTHVKEEHPDNQRFKADCEKWFAHPIETVMNDEYNGSIYTVFERVKFLKGFGGAPCTKRLKRDMRDAHLQYGDRVVIGYTHEEQERLDKFIDANPQLDVWAPLIDIQISKADCLAMIEKAGIELPVMYKLGYNNNNCIGCVKGGKGYWNKIRKDFPEAFERMASIQQKLGPGSFFWPGKNPGDPRISLRTLDPNAGRYQDEPDISCGVICEIVAENANWQ